MKARNSLKNLAVWSDSESEVEPFITRTKVTGGRTAIELSENNFESSFAGADNEQAVDNFNFRNDDLSTDLHVYRQRRFWAREHYKGIQSRNEAKIPPNTTRSATCLHGVREFGMTEHLTMIATLSWNRRILKTLFNFGLSFWLWKSMNQQLRKFVNVA